MSQNYREHILNRIGLVYRVGCAPKPKLISAYEEAGFLISGLAGEFTNHNKSRTWNNGEGNE